MWFAKNVYLPTFRVGIEDKVKHLTIVITQSNTNGKKKILSICIAIIPN